MTRRLSGLALAFTALLAGCNWLGASSTPDRDEPVYVVRGEPFWLQVGETAFGPSGVNGEDGQPLDQSLTFVEVASDSRCPEGAVCVWQGAAWVVVQRAHPTMRFRGPDTLAVGQARDSVRAGGPWRALDLEPYPRADDPAPPRSAYRAQFVLE